MGAPCVDKRDYGEGLIMRPHFGKHGCWFTKIGKQWISLGSLKHTPEVTARARLVYVESQLNLGHDLRMIERPWLIWAVRERERLIALGGMRAMKPVKETALETRELRISLPLREKNYWQSIFTGLHLGYNRRRVTEGSWFIRRYIGKSQGGSPYRIERLATADDIRNADGAQVLSWRQARDLAILKFENEDTAANTRKRPLTPAPKPLAVASPRAPLYKLRVDHRIGDVSLCAVCDESYTVRTPHQIYCSVECRGRSRVRSDEKKEKRYKDIRDLRDRVHAAAELGLVTAPRWNEPNIISKLRGIDEQLKEMANESTKFRNTGKKAGDME